MNAMPVLFDRLGRRNEFISHHWSCSIKMFLMFSTIYDLYLDIQISFNNAIIRMELFFFILELVFPIILAAMTIHSP